MRDGQILWAHGGAAVNTKLIQSPGVYTAALIFDQVHGHKHNRSAAADVRASELPISRKERLSQAAMVDAQVTGAAHTAGTGLKSLMTYTLRLNSTHLPPTQRAFSDVDVGSVRNPHQLLCSIALTCTPSACRIVLFVHEENNVPYSLPFAISAQCKSCKCKLHPVPIAL